MKRVTLRPRTLVAQALGWTEPTFHSLVPPIHPSAPYERDSDGAYPGGHTYTRDQNPTYDQVEAVLAELEGGEEALVFASGMAAATTVFETLSPGDHVVAPRMMYWTIRLWIEDLAARRRFELTLVDPGDVDGLEKALRPGETRLVWVETPANPTLEITDIQKTVEVAHAAGARVVCDGTLSTPVITRPLELGADLVMHSATKQLNGHSDVLAGALVTREKDESWDRIRRERGYRGAVIGPFEAWLLLRGMRTLFLRVPAMSANAARVAAVLKAHAEVEAVMYPGLPDHPGHAVAARQMEGGFGPMVSFQARGGQARAKRLVAALEVFRNATSLGGVESLVEHRAPVEGPGTPVPTDLVRLSVGIEDPGDLVADLERALDETRG